MIKRKGFIDHEKGLEFVKSYEGKLSREKWYEKRIKTERDICWLGKKINFGKNSIIEGLPISKGLKKRCNDLWGGDDWNSILIIRYKPLAELKLHRDRPVFENKTIIINLGCITYFEYGDRLEKLKVGEVIEINNQIEHGVRKVIKERWSISIRKIRC